MAQLLDSLVEEGELYKREPDGRLRCYACGHRCLIGDGRRGICRVRFNRDGRLMVPKGYVGALQCDPIEKKPFFHVLPGSDALTFGMLGCDLHCAYCQNWVTSQALRDPEAVSPAMRTTPEQLVSLAVQQKAGLVASSYNEPLITAEWAMDVFKLARPLGFRTGFVSNGNATQEVLEYLRPFVDCYKVDLKSMSDRGYRQLGGKVATILATIERLVDMGFWVEIVTLIVPGFNDSDQELHDAARFLAGVSPDIPWHVTAYHEDYRMHDHPDTTVERLLRACEIGKAEGLRYVYAGNLPGRVGRWENTYCPRCDELLIERRGFFVLQNRLSNFACPRCRMPIPGIWTRGKDGDFGVNLQQRVEAISPSSPVATGMVSSAR
ncbi:MAG: AmmeMemoRadiSam system radical SAM enzyme [Chloroflexota bacterium]|nr:AmmeMemoRadiSam system radical SAM enzyme [Chloroflexota bacterium]